MLQNKLDYKNIKLLFEKIQLMMIAKKNTRMEDNNQRTNIIRINILTGFTIESNNSKKIK